MVAITFDTHQFVKDLQAKGFNPEQAEGISNALKNIMTVAEVATTRDLKELEITLKADFEIKLAETKADIIKWNVGSVLGSVALAVTLIKLLA
ncbi:hypothetical protein AGMMS50256_19320 [Betaproteobacteria bacterium]|nr:hypothetical protein AGMMS50256_19320 [Betaproteobacteria bacterium]